MYFYLTVFWGDVPWVGEVIQPEDAYIERTPRERKSSTSSSRI